MSEPISPGRPDPSGALTAAPRRLPTPARVLMASVLALAGSLVVDVLLVTIGRSAFPATRNYGHFHFSDYGSLTTLGVVLACAAWMAVTRMSADPRRVFFRVAVVVTFVLWLPDIWLLIRHQPVSAVVILMSMHLGIALVTYYALVVVAPAGEPPRLRQAPGGGRDHETAYREVGESRSAPKVDARTFRLGKRVWVLMMIGVGVELVAGIVALLVVPVRRPDGWLPRQGETAYLIHAGLGGVLTLAAMCLVLVASPGRMTRAGALIGLAGLALGAGGGILAVYHPSRVAGLVLMLAGTVVAFFGYLIPLAEPEVRLETGTASLDSNHDGSS